MAYKRYFYRNGKKIGPYYYESYRDKTGKVKKRYVGTKDPNEKKENKIKQVTPTKIFSKIQFNKKFLLIIPIVFIILILLFGLVLVINNSKTNVSGRAISSISYSTGSSPLARLSGFVVSEIADENTIESFDTSNADLEIKEPEEVLGQVVGKNKNKRMEFNVSDNKIRLYFDLLNYSEFIDNIKSEIITSNATIDMGSEVSSKVEAGSNIESSQTGYGVEENNQPNYGITGNIIRFFGLIGRVVGIGNEETGYGMASSFPEGNETGTFANETAKFAEVSLEQVKEKVEELNEENKSKIDEIADDSVVEAENLDINVSKANDKQYKWGYRVKLNDLNFIAKIDVSSNDSLSIYNNYTLRIGDSLMSFKDLVDAGYKVRFEVPILEMASSLSGDNETDIFVNETIETNLTEEIVNKTVKINLTEINITEIIESENNTESVATISDESEVAERVSGGGNEETEQTKKSEKEIKEEAKEETKEEKTEEKQEKEQKQSGYGVEASPISGDVGTDINVQTGYGFTGNIIRKITGFFIQSEEVPDLEYKNTITVYIERDFTKENTVNSMQDRVSNPSSESDSDVSSTLDNNKENNWSPEVTEMVSDPLQSYDNYNNNRYINVDYNLIPGKDFEDLDNSGNISVGDIINLDPTLILITKAEHLDKKREFESDIYEEVRTKDDNWGEEIKKEEYVRVTFEQNLTKGSDITIYARSKDDKKTAEIGVYRKDDENEIARFIDVTNESWYKVYLTNLSENESNAVFDLKILNNPVEFDYIVDPTAVNDIKFIDFTPVNATATINSSVQINVSISADNLSEVNWNWNGTNFTMYNDSLILMMNFDNLTSLGENSTYAIDVSKYGNNGTLINGAVWNSSGKYNGAMQFDGVNDFINLPDSNSLNITTPITISLWEKTAAHLDITATYGMILIGRGMYGDSGNPSYNTMELFINSTGEFARFDYEYGTGSNENPVTGTTDIADGNWHFVVGQWNGSDCLVYVDGIKEGNVSCPNSPGPFSEKWVIGKDLSTTAASLDSFNGTIDEVRIWNRSLSDSEVYQLYASNLQKYNSTQWYLYINQSQNATTRLDNATYTYFASAKDASENENRTDVRQIIIGSSNNLIPGDIDSCGNITVPGVYNLTTNVGSSGICFNITADNVTLNGNGKLLIYNSDATNGQHGISIGGGNRENITIKNCNIIKGNSTSGYGGKGIYHSGGILNNSNILNNTLLINLTLDDGIYLGNCFNSFISNNTIDSYNGIYLSGVSDNLYILNNVINSTGASSGIQLYSSLNSIISKNIFNHCDGTCFLVSSDASNISFVNQNILVSYNFPLNSFNIKFENTTYGNIYFSNMSSASGNNLIGNSTSSIIIGNNSVYVNSSLAGLNKSANITLYNLPTNFINPLIYRNGNMICNSSTKPSCYNFTSLNAGTVVFNVSSWSNYSIVGEVDTEYPIFYGYWDNNASITSGGIALFNISVNSTNATVWLSINGTNFTASNLSATIFNVTIIGLLNGTYNYNWSAFGNGTSKNFNMSNKRYYQVNATNLIPGNIDSCGNITVPGVYNLIGDVGSSGICFNITADNVTLNGNGKNISSTSSFAMEFSGIRTNITIKDVGNISAGGIFAIYGDNLLKNSFINNNTLYNYETIRLTSSNEVVISNNSLTGGVYAISLSNSTNDRLISNSIGSEELYITSNNLSVIDSIVNGYQAIEGNISFENTTHGIISLVSMSIAKTINLIGSSNSEITIGNNSVYINGSETGLNKKANVTLYNIGNRGFTTPAIKINGTQVCNTTTTPKCYNFTALNASTVIFNVSSWSNYSIGETPDTTSPNITIVAPANNSNFNTTTIVFNASGNENLSWCGLSIDHGANVTMSLNASLTGSNYTNSSMTQGNHNFTIVCNDTSGNYGTSVRYLLYVDNIFPNVTIDSPSNNSWYGLNALFNVSSSEAGTGMIVPNLDNSLVSWWRMDDLNSSGGVVDYMGINNGTPSGAVQTFAGKFGRAISFDGVDDVINIVHDASLNVTKNYSWGAWIYPKSSAVQILLSKHNGNTGACSTWEQYSIWIYNGLIYCFIGNQTDGGCSYSNNQVVDNSPVVLNQWYHIICSLNSSGLYFYKNGILISSDTNLISNPVTSNQPLFIGAEDASPAYAFNGSIDEVMIFNRSLTSDEVMSLYNATKMQFVNNLSEGGHTYKTYTSDLGGNVNASSLINFNVDSNYPLVSFDSLTPANATTTANTSVQMNVSIVEQNLNEVNWNWNGTNYTLYNDSLVLMMNFDNLSALGENDSKVVDVSKYGNNGTVVYGTPTYTANGRYGGAYTFSTSALSAGSSSNLNGIKTLSLWFNSTGSASYEGILDKYISDGDRFIVVKTPGVNFPCLWRDSCLVTSNIDYQGDKKWHNLIAVWNGTNTNMYIDGVLQTGTSTTNFFGAGDGGTLHIGAYWYNTVFGAGFSGTIDELRLYNSSLSASEVYQLYASNLQKFNSTQWYLYVNQSKNATTGLDLGTYTYQTFAKDVVGNENRTDVRQIIIQGDTDYPQFSLYTETPSDPATYVAGVVYQFNVSVNDTNGTVGIQFNGVNYSASNYSVAPNVFNFTIANLGASVNNNYTWWAYGNGTLHRFNYTSGYTYNISKNSGGCNVLFNETSPKTYPFKFRIYTDCNSDFILYRNGTAIVNNSEQDLGARVYSFSVNRTDTQNYTNVVDLELFTIIQATPTLSAYLNGIYNNLTLTYPQEVNASGSVNNGTIKIYRNGADKTSENGLNITLGVGNYYYLFNVTGNQNYSDIANVTLNLTINKAAGLINGTINRTAINFSSFNGTATTNIYVNATNITGDGNCSILVNGSLYNNGTCPQYNITNLSIGFYNITFIYNGNANYSSNKSVLWVNISLDATAPIINLINPADSTSYSSNSQSMTFEYNITDDSNINNCSLIIDGVVNSANSSINKAITNNFVADFSVGTYNWNVNCTDSFGNIGNSSIRSFSVKAPSTTSPSSGGGGGGGAGITPKKEDKLVIENKILETSIIINSSKSRTISVYNSGETLIDINAKVQGVEKFVSVENPKFSLGAGKRKDINITINSLLEPGIYNGKVLINGQESLININVNSKELLFDAAILIPEENKLIESGDKLGAQVNLIPMGEKQRIDATANYAIKDFQGKTYLVESETFLIEEQKTFKKDFSTQNLPPGDYTLGLELIYPNGVAVSSSYFQVKGEEAGLGILNYKVLLIILGIGIIILILMSIFIIRRYKNLKKYKYKKKKEEK